MDRQARKALSYISEKDALHHYMRGAMRGPQLCEHRFEQNLGFQGFIWTILSLFYFGGWVVCNISLVPDNTSMFVLLCVFGGRDLCFGCNFNLG